jgi:opacity protein-like surface antigen
MNYLFFVLIISCFMPIYIFGGSKSYNLGINLSTKYQPIPDGFTLNYSLSMSVGKVLKGNVNILRTNLVSDIEGGFSIGVKGTLTEIVASGYDSEIHNLTTTPNGYLRFNLTNYGKIVPYISLLGGIAITKNYSYTQIVGYGITENSSSKTSFSSGYQLGVNYFISDNLSFHIQYENNLPFSSDVESIKVITWGFQYWF